MLQKKEEPSRRVRKGPVMAAGHKDPDLSIMILHPWGKRFRLKALDPLPEICRGEILKSFLGLKANNVAQIQA